MPQNEEKFELTKEDKKVLAKELLKSLRSVKYLHLAKEPEDSEKQYSAYRYTLRKHGFDNAFDSDFMSPFYKLIKYDKINQRKNDNYFVKLDQMLKFLKTHQEILEDHKNSPKNSTAHTTYSRVKDYITPHINENKDFIQNFQENYMGENINDDQTYKSIQKTAKILKAYQDDPWAGSLCIQASNDTKFDYLTSEHKKELEKLSNKVFSYKIKLSKRDIVKSFQAYAIDIYHKDSVQNQLMNYEKTIDDKLLVSLIGDISKELLDKSVGKPHVKNINSKFQYIDIIKSTLILQPTTTKTKRMKFNSYDELLLKLTESSVDSEQ